MTRSRPCAATLSVPRAPTRTQNSACRTQRIPSKRTLPQQVSALRLKRVRLKNARVLRQKVSDGRAARLFIRHIEFGPQAAPHCPLKSPKTHYFAVVRRGGERVRIARKRERKARQLLRGHRARCGGRGAGEGGGSVENAVPRAKTNVLGLEIGQSQVAAQGARRVLRKGFGRRPRAGCLRERRMQREGLRRGNAVQRGAAQSGAGACIRCTSTQLRTRSRRPHNHHPHRRQPEKTYGGQKTCDEKGPQRPTTARARVK